MGFLATVAFCAAASSGQLSPIAPFECVWVEDEYIFETETACRIRTGRVKESPSIIQVANRELMMTSGKPVANYFTFCVPEDEAKKFYATFGIDAGDLPEAL